MTSPIQVLRTFEAAPTHVFDVWVSPETLVSPVSDVEMDPVVGGSVRISTGLGPESDLRGRFLVVDRPQHLRYTWRWGGFDEESVIDVWFHDLGNATVVEVEHAGFIDESSRQNHLRGWVHYLDSLTSFL